MRNGTLLVILSGLLIASAGCVSKSKHQREVGSLQTQILEMDAALRTQAEKDAALQAELDSLRGGGKGVGVTAEYTGATYRTPSGFELPAVDIQKALKGAGHYTGPVDGKIGPDSREAIRNFQQDHGLTVDGVCGRKTWDQLKTYLDMK